MLIKYLILIGRTFIATFLLVNFFNIIPLNFSSNAWFVQVSMLLVDTSSLFLLGLCCLKLASNLSISGFPIGNIETKWEVNNPNEEKAQKYINNINVINKFSKVFMYMFIIIATIQFFIVFNGTNQLNLAYSGTILQLEKKYQIDKNLTNSESQLDLESDSQNDRKTSEMNLTKKDKALNILTEKKNNAQLILIRNAIKVFLMSLVWAYGFFKLYKFS